MITPDALPDTHDGKRRGLKATWRQVNLRIPPGLESRLKAWSERQQWSRNDTINVALMDWLNRRGG